LFQDKLFIYKGTLTKIKTHTGEASERSQLFRGFCPRILVTLAHSFVFFHEHDSVANAIRSIHRKL